MSSPRSFGGICKADKLDAVNRYLKLSSLPTASPAPPTDVLAAYLFATEVHYRIIDVQVHAEITQTYISNLSGPAEVLYCFPLPPDSAVHAFSATFQSDGRVIKGVVKTRQNAKETYEAAVKEGRRAALMESLNAEIFHIKLGNLPPRETVVVRISIVSLSTPDATPTSTRLTFPSSIAPRYGAPPPEFLAQNTLALPAVASGLRLTASMLMNGRIKGIGCLSHPIQVHLGYSEAPLAPTSDSAAGERLMDPRAAFVELVTDELLDDAEGGDIVLTLDCEGLDQPRCFVEWAEPPSVENTDGPPPARTEAYALTVVPSAELPSPGAQDYIFVVDRSGSMAGQKMKALQLALQIMLKSLPASPSSTISPSSSDSDTTTFNILSFGTSFSSLWDTSMPYTDANVKIASSHVDGMGANMGGTDIGGAVEYALGRSGGGDVSSRPVNAPGIAASPSASGSSGTSVSRNGTKSKRKSWLGFGGSMRSSSSPVAAPPPPQPEDHKAASDEAKENGTQNPSTGSESTTANPPPPPSNTTPKPTSIFILTDGESWNIGQALSLLQSTRTQQRGRLRVFVLGIGNGVSKAVCESIARAGCGMAVYVGEEEGPEAMLVRLVKAARGGVVEVEGVAWPVASPKEEGEQDFALIKQSPSSENVPPLYPGSRTSVYGIAAAGTTSPSNPDALPPTVTLTAKVLGEPLALEVPVFPVYTPPNRGTPNVLHILAARSRLQELDDQFSTIDAKLMYPDSSGPTLDREELESQKAEMQAEGERLGLTYGLVSRWTSFVAVDDKAEEVPVDEKVLDEWASPPSSTLQNTMFLSAALLDTSFSAGQPACRLAKRSKGVGSPALLLGAMVVAIPVLPFVFAGWAAHAGYVKVRDKVRDRRNTSSSSIEDKAVRAVEKKIEAETPDLLDRLVRLQGVDGSFDAAAAVEAVSLAQGKMKTKTKKEAAARITELPPIPPDLQGAVLSLSVPVQTVWATLLVLALMRTYLRAEQNVWGLMGDKAKEFVKIALEGEAAHRKEHTDVSVVSDELEAKRLLHVFRGQAETWISAQIGEGEGEMHHSWL